MSQTVSHGIQYLDRISGTSSTIPSEMPEEAVLVRYENYVTTLIAAYNIKIDQLKMSHVITVVNVWMSDHGL